ncbi:MAG: hypothetical protein RQ936_08735 [Gammaproteobacteria bacterium]|nr:hypothetical protein [Gammaproteobacteria bacterium]
MLTRLVALALPMLLVFNVYAVETGLIASRLPIIERPVVEVEAVPGKDKYISIPHTALTYRYGIPGVFVVQDNKARFRMVQPGEISGKKVKILSGLFGGETLLMGDLEKVHDGSPIKISTRK